MVYFSYTVLSPIWSVADLTCIHAELPTRPTTVASGPLRCLVVPLIFNFEENSAFSISSPEEIWLVIEVLIYFTNLIN